jgi:hypothetical protein
MSGWPAFVNPLLLARRQAGVGVGAGGDSGPSGERFVPWDEVARFLAAAGPVGVLLPEPTRAVAGVDAGLEPAARTAWESFCASDPVGRRVMLAAERLHLDAPSARVLGFFVAIAASPELQMIFRKMGGDPVVDGLTPLAIATILACGRNAAVPALLAPMLPGGALERLGVLRYRGGRADPRRLVALDPRLEAWCLDPAQAARHWTDAAAGGCRIDPSENDGPRFALRASIDAVTAALGADWDGQPLAIRGPDPRKRRDTIFAAAQMLGRPVLHATLAGRKAADARGLIDGVLWAAALDDAIAFIDEVDAFIEELADALAERLKRVPVRLIFGHVGDIPLVFPALPHMHHVLLKHATPKMRQVLVDRLLADAPNARAAMEPVLREFALDLDATAAIALDLAARESAHGGGPLPPGLVAESLRLQLGSRVTDIAEHVPTRGGLRELEVSDEARRSLDEMVVAWKKQSRLLEAWGFGQRIGNAASLSALFHGPPGTGKTLAAAMLAHELGLQLFRVDLSRVVDKYIGETEKQLEKVFSEAERSQVMLLFDEADSLFGARTDVKKASDRYSNLQVSFLLQRIEVHRGVVVLTTNHEAALDQAFRRRIRYSVPFPMPSANERAALWRRLIPAATPIDEPLRFDELGEDFVLSGGHIRNAVLRAAFAAAAAGRGLQHMDLVDAANAEYRGLGHVVRERRG